MATPWICCLAATVKSHKDLDVWKHGIPLVKAVYLATNGYPKEEMHGLASQ